MGWERAWAMPFPLVSLLFPEVGYDRPGHPYIPFHYPVHAHAQQGVE